MAETPAANYMYLPLDKFQIVAGITACSLWSGEHSHTQKTNIPPAYLGFAYISMKCTLYPLRHIVTIYCGRLYRIWINTLPEPSLYLFIFPACLDIREFLSRTGCTIMSSSMNKYWIPHQDIHRKVITQELQYYLGPQATVRPFTLEVSLRQASPTAILCSCVPT